MFVIQAILGDVITEACIFILRKLFKRSTVVNYRNYSHECCDVEKDLKGDSIRESSRTRKPNVWKAHSLTRTQTANRRLILDDL